MLITTGSLRVSFTLRLFPDHFRAQNQVTISIQQIIFRAVYPGGFHL